MTFLCYQLSNILSITYLLKKSLEYEIKIKKIHILFEIIFHFFITNENTKKITIFSFPKITCPFRGNNINNKNYRE